MLEQPDGLVYGLAGGQAARHVTREITALRVSGLVMGVDELLRCPGRGGSVQAPHLLLLLLLLLLLRKDSLLLGDESWLVVAQRGGGWDDIL